MGPCFGIIPLGAAIGVLLAHFTMNKFDRRVYLLLVNCLSLLATGALQYPGVIPLFVFRSIQGIVSGIWMSFIPTYIGELTPKEIGSRFGIYPQVAVVLGVLVSFTVGMVMIDCFDYEFLPTDVPVEQVTIVSWEANVFWRVMFGLALLPSIIQIILIFIGYIPESPYSLISKNRRDEARAVLALFYEEEFVNGILEEREKAIYEEVNNNLEKSITWSCKGYFLGFQLSIFQVMTGIASYVTQTGHVIAVTLQEPIFGIYTPIVITLSQLIGTFISIPLLQYLEWKSLTLIGGFSIALLNGLTGMFLYFFSIYEDFAPYAMTLAVVCIMALLFTFGITVGSASWPYASYMMPSNAVVAAQVLNWLLAGISIIAFSFDTNANSSPVIMLWVYAGVTFVLSVLNWILMINIKGLTIVEVQKKLATD